MQYLERKINVFEPCYVKPIHAVQGSNMNEIRVTIADWDIPIDATVKWQVATSTKGELNNATFDNNTIIIQPFTSTFGEVGHGYLQVRVEKDDKVLVSFAIDVFIQPDRVTTPTEGSNSDVVKVLVDQYVEEATGTLFEDLEAQAQSELASIRATGDAVIASIPSDYSTLSSEVSDIRTGADGTTYPTAGTSVRSQFSNIKADLKSNNLYVQLGTIDASGNEIDSTTSIRTGFFKITGAFTITTASGYSTRLCVYNLDHSVNMIRGFVTEEINISSTKRLFRLVIKKTDGSAISANDFSNAITADFSSCELYLPMSDISSSLMKISEEMPSELKAFIKSNTLFVDRCTVAGGVDQDSETTLTSGFFGISSSMAVSVPSDYQLRVLWYNKDYSFRQAPAWTTSATITDKTYLYRISIRKADQTRIDFSDFNDKLEADFSGCEYFLPTKEIETVLLRSQREIANIKNNPYSLNEVLTNKDNMIWSWWYTPLAVSFKRVRDKLYWGYATHEGYTGVAEYNFETKSIIKNNLKKADVDDHNALAVYVLPNGTIICAYAGGHNTDSKMHIRISETPESIEHFKEDIELSSTGTTSYGQFIFYDDTLYLFYRVSNTKWVYRFSTDGGKTWTDEKVIVNGGSLQYYCKFTETTVDGLVRICMHSNPSSADTNIRMGFINLSTGNIYNSDNTTLLGTQNISHSNFDIIIPNEDGKTQRLFDVGVTAPNQPLVLYAPFTTALATDSIYKLYDSGVTVTVCNGGVSLWQPKYQLGGAFIGTDKIVTSRGYEGKDMIEIYDYSNGSVALNKLVYQESRGDVGIRNARPIVDINGKAFLWHRGYYDPDSYTNFNTDAIIYLMDSEEII